MNLTNLKTMTQEAPTLIVCSVTVLASTMLIVVMLKPSWPAIVDSAGLVGGAVAGTLLGVLLTVAGVTVAIVLWKISSKRGK